MDLFAAVKEQVSVPRAAEFYGLEVDRNKRCRCLFHDDHHPSMKLNEDYYYCFSCGASGDVIALTARMFDLRPYEAAKKLAEDFGIQDYGPPSKQQQMERAKAQQFRETERLCFLILRNCLHTLQRWKEEEAPESPDIPWSEKFVTACRLESRASYLVDCMIQGESPEEVEKLFAYAKKLQEELQYEQENEPCA